MAVLVGDWPADLLEVLFEFIADDKSLRQSGLLTSCLCVSPRWRDIGVRSLWTHISLTSAQLEAFLSVPTPSNYVLIKSLTLRIVPLRPNQPDYKKRWNGEARPLTYRKPPVEWTTNGSPVTKAFWKSLERLQVCLPMMVELQTFSFYVTSNIICPVGFWIRHCDVLQLLASLPSKVENLELDTKGIEVFKEAEQHLCPQIAARIPNLRSLRLRLGRMCHEVLTSECATTHLREIVINLLFPSFTNGTAECIAGQRQQSAKVNSNLRRTLIDKMLGMKDASHSASAMLVLDSSTVIELDSNGKFVLDSVNIVHDRRIFNTINRYDVLAAETLSEPVLGAVARNNHEIRHFNNLSKLDEDISGKFTDLEEIIEGSTWIQTTKGVRLPRSCLPSRRSVAVEQPAIELNAMRAAYEKNGLQMVEEILFLNEEKAGRPLLATRRTPGLGDVEPLRREEVDGEPFDAEKFLDKMEAFL